METIEIDFDVYKELTSRRTSEGVTYNDVLRKLLGLGLQNSPVVPVNTAAAPGEWISKGVRFPNGTEFRATYKGQLYYGNVEGGSLVVDGRRFDSPSPAAVAITNNPVNGWVFWACRMPGRSSWQMIKTLRK